MLYEEDAVAFREKLRKSFPRFLGSNPLELTLKFASKFQPAEPTCIDRLSNPAVIDKEKSKFNLMGMR